MLGSPGLAQVLTICMLMLHSMLHLLRSSCTVISEMLELGKERNPPYFDDFTKKPQYYTKINLY
jgi:hypothetical protein